MIIFYDLGVGLIREDRPDIFFLTVATPVMPVTKSPAHISLGEGSVSTHANQSGSGLRKTRFFVIFDYGGWKRLKSI